MVTPLGSSEVGASSLSTDSAPGMSTCLPGVTSEVRGVLNRSEACEVVRTAFGTELAQELSVAKELREAAVVTRGGSGS